MSKLRSNELSRDQVIEHLENSDEYKFFANTRPNCEGCPLPSVLFDLIMLSVQQNPFYPLGVTLQSTAAPAIRAIKKRFLIQF